MPVWVLVDAAALAVVLCVAVDQVRTLVLGPAHVDPWMVSRGPWFVLPVVLLYALGRLLRTRQGRQGRQERQGRHGLLPRGALLFLAALCLLDTVVWFTLRRSGSIAGSAAWPASLVFALVLVLGAFVPRPRRQMPVLRLGALALFGFLLVVLHLHTFGQTDYRRRADAVVVFGARVHEDGRASAVLRDRTVTACRLFEEGWVRHLVFSGGKADDAPVSEPVAMARIARARGIPDAAIVLDEGGLNTWASLSGVAHVARERGWAHLLAVSTDVHLARVRLLARRAGLDVRTVPAVETMDWPKPRFVLRESLAWGWWYLRSALP